MRVAQDFGLLALTASAKIGGTYERLKRGCTQMRRQRRRCITDGGPKDREVLSQ
jgi:hypothetical protein